jgi:molybdopterin-guanine dinucleotide biosynthesis protein A
VSTLEAVGFVVAGGRSRRMGRDKALLGWGGATLIDHAISTLGEVCSEVRVLSGLQRRYTDRGRAVVVDVAPDAGPLGGLGAALANAAPRPVILLAVDMPFVPAALLRDLGESLAGWDVAVPVIPAGPEPLCAAYANACQDAVRDALAAGERKMTSFWPRVRVRERPAQELARFGPPERMFRNLNDPSEYDAASNGRTR